jgi:SAM-dependent methyltransferase
MQPGPTLPHVHHRNCRRLDAEVDGDKTMEVTNSHGHQCGQSNHEGIILDIGCGNARRRGTIGIDFVPGEQVDHVRDLESHGLPFCDRSVEGIYAHNVLEHLGDGFHFLMKECWRVLKDGGFLDISVPGADSEGFKRDPTHKRSFTKNTFGYFTKGRPKYHSYMDGFKWKVEKLEGDNDGTILVRMTPDR